MNLTRLKSSSQAQNEAFGQNLLLDPSENISRNRSFLHRKVAKLNAAGSLVYSTYLGGSNDDGSTAIAVDSSGDAYVAGVTRSEDFPTANAFQASCDACSTSTRDAFVAKISPLDAPGVSLSPLRLVFASQTV